MIPFGFEVKLIDKDWRDNPLPPTWAVALPHQCDDWDIAGEDGKGVSHERAVADLERFIAEAREALQDLKAERQVSYSWKYGDPAPTRVVS